MLARRIAGVEVPDTRAVFLIVLAVHVVAALACVVTGVLAMTAPKRAGRHPRAGRTTTQAGRCPGHRRGHGGAQVAARPAPRRHRRRVISSWRQAVCPPSDDTGLGWRRVHIPAMGGSYIALLTAFCVDNGRSLPVWDWMPHPAYWLLPGFVGVPVILRAMRRHRVLGRRPPAVRPSGG